MKFIRCMIIFAVLSAVFSVSAESAWTYDADAKTITDGFWTLTVKSVSGNNLTVTGFTGSAAEGGEDGRSIDLTDVKDKAGNVYRVVAFEGFSGQNSTKSTLWAKKDILTEFIAPDCSNVSGQYAFNQCKSLTKVALNDAADVSLSAAAFDGCASLADFAPRKVKSAGVFLFRNCVKLTGAFELTGSAGIGQEAFSNVSLDRIVGSNVATVGQSAFNNCLNLKEVSFPNATSIGQAAFSKCAQLERVDCPNVSEILHSAFDGCTSIDESDVKILLNAGIKKLGFISGGTFYGSIFAGCTGIKGKIIWDFPNLSTNAVPPNMFENCSSITAVEFKTPVCNIGDKAFAGISSGAEIYLGKSKIKVYGKGAVCSANAPYPKIYVRDDDDEMFAAMDKTNATLRDENFRNQDWVSHLWKSDFRDAYKFPWMKDQMCKDDQICEPILINDVSYPKARIRRVYGFLALYDKSHLFCWVIGESPRGFSVKVR